MLNHKSSLVTAKNYAELDYSHVDAWGGSTRQLQAPAVLVSKMPKPTVAAGPFVARMKKRGGEQKPGEPCPGKGEAETCPGRQRAAEAGEASNPPYGGRNGASASDLGGSSKGPAKIWTFAGRFCQISQDQITHAAGRGKVC